MEDLQRNEALAEDAVSGPEAEIDLIEILLGLVGKWKTILAVALLGAALMAFFSCVIADPVYEATSKLYVLNAKDSAINLSDLQIGSYLTADYQQVFDAWEVHEMVRQNLGLDHTYKQLKNMLTIENPSNTRILHITVSDTDPEFAAMLANEYAYVAKKYISETMETDEPKVLSEALTPVEPVSPKTARNIVLGFFVGMFLVCGVIVIQHLLDDKLRTSEDISRYIGIPTLAVIPQNGTVNQKARK